MKSGSIGEVSGFLKAEGKRLVNGEGREILLRGVGLGSWLLPEGYMWRLPEQGDRPRRIERMIGELVGARKAALFWELYDQRYITEADIRQIAAEGFNSVRVPVNARHLVGEDGSITGKERHWPLIDRVIDWCKTHRLYVILDLHGAPGGQTGTNIDDSERDLPELFTIRRNGDLAIALWRKLAERYRDEWIVAGYDLLNEPLPDWFSAYYDRVMPLYREMVKAIREVDSRHMIILEGVHWSTDWSIFDDKPDDNLMLQFHKYWNNPDTASIRTYLDKREAWNVPIFMGEGGENNKDWYAGAFRLFEDHRISWNFWTWKKMDTDNSPCSIRRPVEWQLLADYLEGGDKPDAETAERVLWEYLDNLLPEKCVYHPEVCRSLLRVPSVRIPAVFYGFQGEGNGYGISARAKRHVGFRMEDGTDIRFVEGTRTTANFRHGGGEAWQADERLCVQLSSGDWLAYDFSTGDRGEEPYLTVDIRMYAPDGRGRLAVSMNGIAAGAVEVDRGAWATVRLEGALRPGAGQHRIVLQAEHGPVRVEWLEVNKVQ